ncbi:MAG: XRE family transcriptional regulator [Verrucomicrobiaceae bacterium]|nr:MAG: XRE family transcriptional regulator [Verrucomicrobiaceae bacterium]
MLRNRLAGQKNPDLALVSSFVAGPKYPELLITTICDLLMERRLELGASIYSVAQASGVTQQAIGNYERKKRQPSLDCLVKVSGALGLTPVDLFRAAQDRIGPPPPRQIAAPARKKKTGEESSNKKVDSTSKKSRI